MDEKQWTNVKEVSAHIHKSLSTHRHRDTHCANASPIGSLYRTSFHCSHLLYEWLKGKNFCIVFFYCKEDRKYDSLAFRTVFPGTKGLNSWHLFLQLQNIETNTYAAYTQGEGSLWTDTCPYPFTSCWYNAFSEPRVLPLHPHCPHLLWFGAQWQI